MKDYRPLLLQALDLRLPGLRLRRLCLHKHLPEADALEMHRHKFCQILCYFSDGGTLLTPSAEYQVFSGAIALLPSGMAHGFPESIGRRPGACDGISARLSKQAIQANNRAHTHPATGRAEFGKSKAIYHPRTPDAGSRRAHQARDPNYFSRWFKRHTGMPPSHYVRRPENSAKKSHATEPSGLPRPVSGG